MGEVQHLGDAVNHGIAKAVSYTHLVVTVLPEVLRGMEDYRMLAYAIVLILIMLLNASPRFAALKNRLIRKSGKKKKGEVA